MNKPPIRHFSRLGLLGSILFHTALVSGVFTLMKTQQPQPKEVEVSSISMEMLSSFIEEQESEQKVEQKTEQPQLEQPQAAVRTETTQAEEKITQKAPALQPQKRVSEPQKVKPKKEKIVKETPKEKIVEKTKPEPKKKEKLKAEKQQAEKQQVEKPKKTEKITAEKPIKAVEKGIVAQSGIVLNSG